MWIFLRAMLRNKERLALVLLGIMLVAMASGLAAATARSTQGAVDEELAKYWRTDYDLLIRHPSSVTTLEKEWQAIPGNYQANFSLNRGISHDQLLTIRNINGVEVAAPLTFAGYANGAVLLPSQIQLPPAEDLEPGIYRLERTFFRDTGLSVVPEQSSLYFLVSETKDISVPPGVPINFVYPYSYWNEALAQFPYNFVTLVAAVDVEAEAKLSGLKDAVIRGQYLNLENSRTQDDLIPALINQNLGIAQGSLQLRLDRLELDYRNIRPESDVSWLQQVSGKNVWDFREEIQVSARDAAWSTDEKGALLRILEQAAAPLNYRQEQGLLYLDAVDWFSSDRDGRHWQHSSSILIPPREGVRFYSGPWEQKGQYTQDLFRKPGNNLTQKGLAAAGYFDPAKLTVARGDSPVAAPLEIYGARLPRVLDTKAKGSSSSQAQPLHRLGYGPLEVGAIIPLEDLMTLIPGEFFYDTIRVRVSGVDDMSQQSQVKIASIAQEIRQKTGLHVDIILGSSRQRTEVELYSYSSALRDEYQATVGRLMEDIIPQLEEMTGYPVKWDFASFPYTEELWVMAPEGLDYLTGKELSLQVTGILQNHLGEYIRGREVQDSIAGGEYFHLLIPDFRIGEREERDYLGRVEEYWIKLGTQLRIYQETNRGTFWITLGLLVVSALFIGNTTYISAVGRTRQFVVLRSLGWRRGTVFRISLTETLLISLIAAVVTASVLGILWVFSNHPMEPALLLATVPGVFIIFLVGSLPPLVKTLFIQPLKGLKQGELRQVNFFGGGSSVSFVLRGLCSRPGRSLVTVLALTIPASLLSFMYSVFFGIQAVLGETLLGEFMALELRGYHFLLNGLVFVLAGLVVTDTLLINLRERLPELGLLKAVGWRNVTIARLLFWEGVGLGLLGGLLGVPAGGYIYWRIFSALPPNLWLNGILLGIIPGAIGGIAAIIPALRAARIPAAQVIKAE